MKRFLVVEKKSALADTLKGNLIRRHQNEAVHVDIALTTQSGLDLINANIYDGVSVGSVFHYRVSEAYTALEIRKRQGC